jgi:glycosyltransferase involved in cell wall biosynthesis
MLQANADVYYQRTAGKLTGVVATFARLKQKKSIFAVAGEPMIRFRRDLWMYEYGIRNVDRVIVQSEAQMQYVKETFGRDAILIPNCYEDSLNNKSVRAGTVLWAAMIRKVKRPDLFLDIVAAIPEVHFTMVGGASNEERDLYARVKSRADGLRNLDFVGYVHPGLVHEYFDKAALFVNTSVREGFPNTFLQSWSRGVPTISFVDCGARRGGQPIGEIVTSPEEMKRSIKHLMKNNELRIRIGSECERYAREKHSMETVLSMYEELIDSLFHRE